MLTITAPTAYLQQPGLRKQAGEHIQPYARELRILTSPRAWQAVNSELSHSLESAGIRWQLEYLDGECTDEAINRLRDNVVAQGAQGIIVLAGLANSVHDDLPTPGVAHEIHNRLTHEPELHDLLHGEKVGYCLLIQSLLERGQQPDEQLVSLLRQYDSPLTLSALTGDVAARLRQIAREIAFPAVSLTHLPFAITLEKLERALVATIPEK